VLEIAEWRQRAFHGVTIRNMLHDVTRRPQKNNRHRVGSAGWHLSLRSVLLVRGGVR
jgi:hypothetical protein